MTTEKQAKTGLIVVDLQKAFRPPEHLVEGIRSILGDYDIVVATQFLNKVWSLYETELGYTHCQVGSPEAEIVIPLRPKLVFDRFVYGLQAPHIEKLKQLPVMRWDIVGCDTEACVLSTCYDLWNNNIKFRVLKDLCHSSGGTDFHEAALKVMQRSFGAAQVYSDRN